MIAFTALNKKGNDIDFVYDLNSVEANVDFLSNLVAQGYTLLSVQLLDTTGRTNLPPAAFDGRPLSGVVQALQQEWQAILSQPNPSSVPRRAELIRLTRQRSQQAQLRMAAHERMIGYGNRWLQRTQASSLADTHKTQLMNRYKAMIDAHTQQLQRVQLGAQWIANRLNALLAA